MKQIILAAMILSAGPSFAAEATKKLDAVKKVKATKEISEQTVGVKGMVCAFCAQGIEKKFKAQKEVESVQVSLEKKFVKLKYKDGQKLSNERIAEILKDAGYEADFKQ